ncbi:TonB-dependent receptor plug domain-containing protein [Pectobacterium atrosepticum]|uniref:FusA n=1 Tax=Pectobacterium carotovorum TaxID=554 RepID=A0A1P8STS3_PECCA|nr:TonB-dependent receptor plug domain-containing protein [Pectobacterium atrosepticum]APY27175.1 FusA [Pectobacterium carotovorum]GKV85453.1 TonB-dependent receptor [Pectobacterium carotovorum subsp. carotovorum]ATY89692.1 TonB-dependent receptor [Pectobacterium atrosepticum]KFX10958.1 TonB-dependent receptor [Pectobacterium atrosepticum]KMK80299.1 TonB-dependent receptor plug [Pectobacterium atrosepticum ICMP 1526]
MNKNVYLMMLLSLLSGPALAQQNDTSADENQQKKNAETEEEQQSDSSSGNSEDTILVRSTPTSQSMGSQIINAEQIKKMPTGNGSVPELLKNNPAVQFSNTANSSNTPGELAPENVSFHGEKFYNNNFMIDGLSNNSNINPGANKGELGSNPDGYSPTDLPAGGTQSFWINSELIESLEVFDSNISAKYGDFTGGVVDARLMDPKLDKASGKISYRTSRDSWTSYHVDESISDEFYSGTNLYYQPKFKKQFYSATFNQPLSDKAGFIFAYNRQQSDIPHYQEFLRQWSDQERISETYLLKGSYLADNGDIVRMTGMYSPHESKYYKKNVKNGSYTNNGGGHRFNMEWEHNARWGKMTSLAGYQFEQNKIEHESNEFISWFHTVPGLNFTSPSLGWQTTNRNSQVGGYGTFTTEKKTTTLKQDYELNPVFLLGMTHQVDFGWQTDFASAQYIRSQNANFASVAANAIYINPNVVCLPGDTTCIPGEQFAGTNIVYPARSVQVSNINYAVYLQDSMAWGRLEVTPGVRVTYDDFLENLNVAPRFAASYDVFGDRSTRVFGGANRYYATNLLTYKLRQGIGTNTVQNRRSPTAPWTAASERTGTNYAVSDLNTPYSDEVTLGLSQRVMDTVWTAKWVNRQGKDQFGRETTTIDGQSYRVMNNDGRTEGNTLSLEVEPISPHRFSFAEVNWKLGASITKNKANSIAYYEDTNTDESRVIVDGKLMYKGDMDAMDFNTPWRAFLSVDTYFPAARLNWGQSVGYIAGYKGYTTLSSATVCPGGSPACNAEPSFTGSAIEYISTQYDDFISYDWRFSYSQPVYKTQTLDITLDVLNVLDNVVETSQKTASGSAVTYKPGRQFWLGVAYTW